jgi:hypothetical protein
MTEGRYNLESSMSELKKDTSRLVKTFKIFVQEYKTALQLLIDSVNELEVLSEEIIQNQTEVNEKERSEKE